MKINLHEMKRSMYASFRTYFSMSSPGQRIRTPVRPAPSKDNVKQKVKKTCTVTKNAAEKSIYQWPLFVYRQNWSLMN